jgi:hypothetical protein
MSVIEAPVEASVGLTSTPEQALPLDHEYWLSHCEGYRVDKPGGRIGLVEEVRHAPDDGRAESLAVLVGMLGRRRLIVSVSEVDAIVPHAERIYLKAGATLLRSEPRGGNGLASV